LGNAPNLKYPLLKIPFFFQLNSFLPTNKIEIPLLLISDTAETYFKSYQCALRLGPHNLQQKSGILLERLRKKMICGCDFQIHDIVSSLLETPGLAGKEDNRLNENPGWLGSKGYSPFLHKVVALMRQNYYSCPHKHHSYNFTRLTKPVKDKMKKYHFF